MKTTDKGTGFSQSININLWKPDHPVQNTEKT